MKCKDLEAYLEWKAKNDDPYGSAVFRYLEGWADLMEHELDNGKAVREVADKTSHDADTEGITGFMYGCAVQIMSECWEHGEELRVWHNSKYGVTDITGKGVVNPAILTIGNKDEN